MSNKAVSRRFIELYAQQHDDVITERWELGDLLSMMQQLGLVPTP